MKLSEFFILLVASRPRKKKTVEKVKNVNMLYGLKKMLKSGAVSCRLHIKSLHDGRKMNQLL